jgi:hypothetical protein
MEDTKIVPVAAALPACLASAGGPAVAGPAKKNDHDLLMEIIDHQRTHSSGEPIRLSLDTVPGFEALQRAARLFATSSLVPPQYQGNLPNCTIALNMATRMGADPLMVMQNLYLVHGRPGWSSQFYIAAFNTCGRFGSVRYKWIGKKGQDDWGCIACAKDLASGEILEGPEVTIALAKAEQWVGRTGSKWLTMPQLMLTYRAASFLVRTVAPELTMGLRTAEELEEMSDETKSAASIPAVFSEVSNHAVPAVPAVSAVSVPATRTSSVKAKLAAKAAKSAPATEPAPASEEPAADDDDAIDFETAGEEQARLAAESKTNAAILANAAEAAQNDEPGANG